MPRKIWFHEKQNFPRSRYMTVRAIAPSKVIISESTGRSGDWMDQIGSHAGYADNIQFLLLGVASDKLGVFMDSDYAGRLPLTIKEGDGEIRKSTDAPGSPRPMRYSSLSLQDVVCLCAGPRDDEAWEEFVSRVGRRVSLTILRTASLWGEHSRSIVEDLIQETYFKLWEDGCRLLRDFAIQHSEEEVFRYLKTTAANVTHDHFRHENSKRFGGGMPHVSTSDVDPVAGKEVHGTEERIAFRVLLREIDEHLKHHLTGPDQERDRTIFGLYFLLGMGTKEIASHPNIGLSAKGVGSVIERLKCCIREQILGVHSVSRDDRE
jgi:DNA-directed RNA polymerase specialized sigma24 family protein